jgi:omega-amidase
MTDLRLALVQADLRWEDPTANLAHFDELLTSLPASDVIVLPEMFSTGFSMRARELAEVWGHGQAQDWMRATARTHNTAVVGSLIILDEGEDEGRYYNRLVVQLPDGDRLHYDKRHMFSPAGEDETYTAGTDRLVFAWRGWRISPYVCYDLRFPVWMRNRLGSASTLGSEGEGAYDLALVVANWPNARGHHWRRLLAARAIENQCYLAAVNRVGTDGKGHQYDGDTALYDAHGEALVSQSGREGVLLHTISLGALTELRERLPFYREADAFELS